MVALSPDGSDHRPSRHDLLDSRCVRTDAIRVLRCAFCHEAVGVSLVVRAGVLSVSCPRCPKMSPVRCPACRGLLRADPGRTGSCRGCSVQYRVERGSLVHVESPAQEMPATDDGRSGPADAAFAPAPEPARVRAAARPRLEIVEGASRGGFRDHAPTSVTITQPPFARGEPGDFKAVIAVFVWMGFAALLGGTFALVLSDHMSRAALTMLLTAWAVLAGMAVPIAALFVRSLLRLTRSNAVRRLRVTEDAIRVTDGGSTRTLGLPAALDGVRTENRGSGWRVVIEADGREDVAFDGLEEAEAAQASDAIRRAVTARRARD